MRLREICVGAIAAALALGLSSCLLPVRAAPGVVGTIVDRATGEPVEGAIVVVRFDGRYGDQLPDREHLGHVETRTGPDGGFRVERYVRGGLTVWPLFRTEVRVAAVLRSGYRCPVPVHVREDRAVRIALTRALDVADQRDSCRPVAARRGEAESYQAAWRELFPAPETPEDREQRRQLARLLEARAPLGFGENCEGPVTDLALAPGGGRVAFVATGPQGAEVQLVELDAGGPWTPKLVNRTEASASRRLAWTGQGDLVLWQPASSADRAVSPSIFARGEPLVLWTASRSLPARLDRDAPATSRHGGSRPLEPEDLSDEADTLWLGRTFSVERTLDAETGLSLDRLRVTHDDGSLHAIELPGEACGGPRFGRPHYRIAAPGRVALDLRFVDGGCHAVAIDLENGAWQRLDRADLGASCRAQRNIPPAQLAVALRGWTRDLHAELEAAGADTGSAFSLDIGRDGATRVTARNHAGQPLTMKGPRFPITTPLRRIDVTNVAPRTPGERVFPHTAPAQLEPL